MPFAVTLFVILSRISLVHLLNLDQAYGDHLISLRLHHVRIWWCYWRWVAIFKVVNKISQYSPNICQKENGWLLRLELFFSLFSILSVVLSTV